MNFALNTLQQSEPILTGGLNGSSPRNTMTMQLNDSSVAPMPASGKALERADSPGADDNGMDRSDGQHHPIAEFLYQLTKMLTDDNTEIIEWSDGRIKVHYPDRLESEVLHKYFRHSKFASFQRQLNYFGFRKIAGKGKMSPCSYVNDAATSDIRSLLLIKRKTNGSAARKAAVQQRAATVTTAGVNPALIGLDLAALAGQPLGAAATLLSNPAALSSAMALLSENALRAGLQTNLAVPQAPLPSTPSTQQQWSNLIALQQQQLQLQQQQLAQLQRRSNEPSGNSNPPAQNQSFNPTPAPVSDSILHAATNSMNNSNSLNLGKSSAPPTMEQLQAHLAVLAANQQNALNAANALRNSMSAPAPPSSLPATAALESSTADQITTSNRQSSNSMPATAAMNAATAQTSNSIFDSVANLNSLLTEHSNNNNNGSGNDISGRGSGGGGVSNSLSSQILLNRLPSSNTIFPESMSTVSFGNLLGSSNRLSSLLSINSLFSGSREQSLADFAAVANNRQLAASVAAAAAGQSQQAQTNYSLTDLANFRL